MERLIKFRVWATNTKTMHYDRPSFVADYFNRLAGIETTLGKSDIILEQFTGLLDKNGKEIYEGDILKINTSGELDYLNYIDSNWNNLSIVEWKDYAWMPFMETPLLEDDDFSYEVIGNIHETDLLESKQEK